MLTDLQKEVICIYNDLSLFNSVEKILKTRLKFKQMVFIVNNIPLDVHT